jgi:hypothetical protein
MTSVHHRMWCCLSYEDAGWRGAGPPVRGKAGVAGWIPAGGSTNKGNRSARRMGAPARHRGLIRGHGCWVIGDAGYLRA